MCPSLASPSYTHPPHWWWGEARRLSDCPWTKVIAPHFLFSSHLSEEVLSEGSAGKRLALGVFPLLFSSFVS
jgi:hypothetical protein